MAGGSTSQVEPNDWQVVEPNDWQTVGSETSAAPKKLSLVEKGRNLLMKGTTEGPGHFKPEDQPGFDFPPWLKVAGAASMLGEGAAMSLASKTIGPLARTVAGGAAALGTGAAVDAGARALGLPGWVSEILAVGAGAAVGGKVGLSPETIETIKSGGARGLIRTLLQGSTSESEAFAFYRETHGVPPTTGAERLAARAEAAAYKKQIARSLEPQVAKVEKAEVSPQAGGPKKQLLKFTPGRQQESGVANPDIVGGTKPKLTQGPTALSMQEPAVEPGAPPSPQAGAVKKQLLKKTAAGAEPSGSARTQPRYNKFSIEAKAAAGAEAEGAEAAAKADDIINNNVKSEGPQSATVDEPFKTKKGTMSQKGPEHTSLMRSVFANAKDLGFDQAALKISAGRMFPGKSVSQLSYDELSQLSEYLLKNKKLP